MSTFRFGLAVVTVIAGHAGVAEASTVTFAFSGRVTLVADFRGVIGDTVRVGDPFSGFYTFDSESPDPDPNPHFGVYPLQGFLGAVGPNGFSHTDGSQGRILIAAPGPISTFTAYSVFAQVGFLGQPVDATIRITDETMTLFPTDELPVVPPPIEDATRAVFNLGALSKDFSLSGELQSLTLVPEPTSAVLLALAGLTLVRRRRRRVNSYNCYGGPSV